MTVFGVIYSLLAALTLIVAGVYAFEVDRVS